MEHSVFSLIIVPPLGQLMLCKVSFVFYSFSQSNLYYIQYQHEHSGSFYTQSGHALFTPKLKQEEEQEENPPNIAQNGNSCL